MESFLYAAPSHPIGETERSAEPPSFPQHCGIENSHLPSNSPPSPTLRCIKTPSPSSCSVSLQNCGRASHQSSPLPYLQSHHLPLNYSNLSPQSSGTRLHAPAIAGSIDESCLRFGPPPQDFIPPRSLPLRYLVHPHPCLLRSLIHPCLITTCLCASHITRIAGLCKYKQFTRPATSFSLV